VAVLDYFGGAKYVPLEDYYSATPYWVSAEKDVM
jgi:hypothetical protein